MSKSLEYIATDKQIYLIKQIEYHMGKLFRGKTRKDVWKFINDNIEELPYKQLETTLQKDFLKHLQYGKRSKHE